MGLEFYDTQGGRATWAEAAARPIAPPAPRRVALLVSATMLVWLVTNPMFGAVLDLLRTRRLGPLLLALALFPVLQWLRAWRFALLLRRSAEPPGWPDFALATQLSFLNLVLPFKLGDFSFPLLARRIVGADVLDATVAIVWCRVNDLCVVLAVLAQNSGTARLVKLIFRSIDVPREAVELRVVEVKPAGGA